MRYIISVEQLKKIEDLLYSGKVVCIGCGWSWKLSEGGDDPFICHKCGYNNEE